MKTSTSSKLRKFKPYTSTLRYKVLLDTSHLEKTPPPKSLLKPCKSKAGRNNKGRISMRHRGGGHKKLYRVVDFKRSKSNIPGTVTGFYYDPNRSANLALVKYKDGEYRFILASEKLQKNDVVQSGLNAPTKVGNTLPLKNIPIGSSIHNVELHLGKGGQLVRSAGASAVLIGFDEKYALVKLPSGEVRKILKECNATMGEMGNKAHSLVVHGKAGRRRWLGRRPHVRGVAMNPVDHPLGGGEGKSSGGRHPSSPTGQLAKGYKTRKKRNISDKFIIQKRKLKRRSK